MKNIALILLVFAIGFTTSCKKAKLTNKVENSNWTVSQVLLNSEDKTAEILKSEIIYTQIEYSSESVSFVNPNRENYPLEETGEWTLEKIVPTVGESYYLIKNTMIYSQKRATIFNLHEYGSEVEMTDDNQLKQSIGDYTVIYEKVN